MTDAHAVGAPGEVRLQSNRRTFVPEFGRMTRPILAFSPDFDAPCCKCVDGCAGENAPCTSCYPPDCWCGCAMRAASLDPLPKPANDFELPEAANDRFPIALPIAPWPPMLADDPDAVS